MMRFNYANSGLGGNIGMLSLLIHTKQNIELVVEPDLASSLKSILNVFNQSYDNINITSTAEPLNFQKINDSVKFFSPYMYTEKIHVNGNNYWIDSQKRKPMIALACYTDANQSFDSTKDKFTFPFNKQYQVQYYSKLFGMIKRAGYDVVNLDSRKISFENKVYILNEMCDAVIGYEGGMMHVAHVLKMPCIMLPWHSDNNGNPLDSNNIRHQLYHLDSKTWFLDNINDVLTWDKSTLEHMIDSLKNNKGNNKYLVDSVITVDKNLDFISRNKFMDYLHLSDDIKSIIFNYYKNEKLKISGVTEVNYE